MRFIELTVTGIYVSRTDTRSHHEPLTTLINCSMIVLAQPLVGNMSGSVVWLSDTDGTALYVAELFDVVRAAIISAGQENA